MITNNLSTLKIHKLSQNQYDREKAAGNLDSTALYLTPDEDDLSIYATKYELDDKADKEHVHEISDINGLQSKLDEKANTAHNHTVANITDLTASATELNYTKGLTKSIKTSLDELDEVKLEESDLENYYTKTEVDSLELITLDDIDAICGSTISVARGVIF